MSQPSRFICILLIGVSLLVTACAAPAATLEAPATVEPTVAPSATPTIVPPTAAAEAASSAPPATTPPAETATVAPASGPSVYQDSINKAEVLLAEMTLEEKIGQMALAARDTIGPADVKSALLGSVLSGGGSAPRPNTPENWVKMVNAYQQGALGTRLAIPIIYGIDAIHGHATATGATIFPHNIGLGATGDADLVEQIGQATAQEMLATGIVWNFGPVVAAPHDIRWGRTYESYSENTELVSTLGAAYIRGLQNGPTGQNRPGQLTALATPKHFVGDGGTVWGTSTRVMSKPFMLDQGDMQVDEATLRAWYLPPYQAAIDAGALCVMVSFNSWNGLKMHGHKYLLTDVLKGELGFVGFVVSDWAGIDQLPGDYYSDVVTSINAGVDMVMVPYNYNDFLTALTEAVNKGDVAQARVDDAVRRILTAKFALGVFERPYADESLIPQLGSAEHRALARTAVSKSLVLLKNEAGTLPLAKDTPAIVVAGSAADDIGIQCGGWSSTWQGEAGNITPGTTILEGIQAAVTNPDAVVADADGVDGPVGVAIAVVGEMPYAEGEGDSDDLSLSPADQAVIEQLRAKSNKLVIVIVSGRPMIITDQLAQADAVVAAWLPGTEGAGVADGLFGDAPFTGKLPYTWPRRMDQLPFDFTAGPADPLFPFGYGLQTSG